MIKGRVVGLMLVVSIVVLAITVVYDRENIQNNISNKFDLMLESSDFVEQSDIDEQTMHFALTAEKRRTMIKDGNLWDLMWAVVPQIRCPTVVRPGRIGDGGKWICNPWRAPDACVVYSFGVNGDTSFEKGMHEVTKQRCKIFSFDLGKQKPEIFEPFHGTFRQYAIVNATDKKQSRYTVVDVAKEFGHNKIDFMKMDIETWEFVALTTFLNSKEFKTKRITVCQISIEFHHYKHDWVKLLYDIEKNGFFMFYKEGNHIAPYCYEYSYIHESCLKDYGVFNQPYNYNFD